MPAKMRNAEIDPNPGMPRFVHALGVTGLFRRAITGYLLLLAGFALSAPLFHHAQGLPSDLASARVGLWEGTSGLHPFGLLLWTGIVGMAIVTLLFASLALGLWRLFQRAGGERRMALAALTVMAIAFTASTTQTYLTSPVSWFHLAAFLGPAYALVLQGKAADPASSPSSPETSGRRE